MPEVTRTNERKVLLSFVMIFIMLVEAIGGVLSGFLALLADAAFHFGRRAADSKHTFGYLRFEVIAGFVML